MNCARFAIGIALAIMLAGCAAFARADDDAARLRSLDGVYESVEARDLPAGRRNQGSVDRITSVIHPTSGQGVMQSLDPDRLCQAVGPFRMMAKEPLRFELVAGPDRLVVLFQDLSRGYLRSLYTQRSHPQGLQPHFAFQGDSVARWEGNSLIVDTIGFNDRTWLNDQLKASDALHLVERMTPIANGRWLEYSMTASDQGVLGKPYRYVRFFRRSAVPIQQDVCEPQSDWSPDKGF